MSEPKWRSYGAAEATAARQIGAGERFEERYAAAVRTRQHLWTAHVMYTVTPPLEDGTLLDVENLAGPPLVGCFICEQEWEPRLKYRDCPGEPRPVQS